MLHQLLPLALIVSLAAGCGRTNLVEREELEAPPPPADAGCTLQASESFIAHESTSPLYPGVAVTNADGPVISWTEENLEDKSLAWTVRALLPDGTPAPFPETALRTFLPAPPYTFTGGPDLSAGPGPFAALSRDSVHGARLAVRDPDVWRQLTNLPDFGTDELDLLRSDSDGLLVLRRGKTLKLVRLSPADGALLSETPIAVPNPVLSGAGWGFDGKRLLMTWPRGTPGDVELQPAAHIVGAGGPVGTWKVPADDFLATVNVSPGPDEGWYVAWGGKVNAAGFHDALHWALLQANGGVRYLDWNTDEGGFIDAAVSTLGAEGLLAVLRPGPPGIVTLNRVLARSALEPKPVEIQTEPFVNLIRLVPLSPTASALVTWEERGGIDPRWFVRVTRIECAPAP